MSECDCQSAGWCSRFTRQMTLREWELCSGKCPRERPCPSDELLAAYRGQWAVEAAPWPLARLWRFRQWLRAKRPKVRRGLRFARALLRHALAGFPRASPADVEFRRSICGPCFWRDREKDECSQCGCNLGGVKLLPNKLKMAGESCPMWNPETRPGQYWGPVPGMTIWVRMWRRLWRKVTGR